MFHVGDEQVLSLNGQPFRLSRLTRGVLRRWLRWASRRLPDPVNLALAVWDRWPEAGKVALAKVATELAEVRRTLADPAVAELWATDEGQRELLGLLLERHHPAVDGDQLAKLYEEAKAGYNLAEVLTTAAGEMPEDTTEKERQAYIRAGLLPPDTPGKDRPVDWLEVDRNLFQHLYIMPHQADEMTLPEIAAMSSQKRELTLGEAIEHARLYPKLSPLDRLLIHYKPTT